MQEGIEDELPRGHSSHRAGGPRATPFALSAPRGIYTRIPLKLGTQFRHESTISHGYVNVSRNSSRTKKDSVGSVHRECYCELKVSGDKGGISLVYNKGA